ncbi:MAG: alpha/beta fold hydrolase [Pseudomonadales bacterium]
MSSIRRDGVEIYYEHHGCARKSAPTMLLSHGYSATSAMWQGQIEALTADHHLIIWDMRGHGRSDSPDDPAAYSEALTVADMAALLDACEVDRAVIGGLSLGGYMSLAFHLDHPQRTHALMLFDTGPGYRNPQGRAGWNRTAEARARALESDGLAALGDGHEVRISQHRSAQGLAHAARGMLAQVDDRIMRSLATIQVPTLVLVGADDEPFRIPTDYMANKIANAERVVLDGAGHAANIDQPEAFNAAVLAFLRSALG